MTLREVIGEAARDAPAIEVRALAYDNRAVTPGTVFFCVPGFTRDGHDFAPDAVARGAVALVVERPLGLGVPEVVVPDVRAAMAPAAARLHGDPTATLRTVGVTGTNGKTTTAHLVRAILEHAGEPTGLLGTVTQVVGGETADAIRTTPEAIDLQRMFAAMLAGGDRACVMEVSSHALALGRAAAIHWEVGVFTNLSQDHLDFHADMDDYFAAKRALFLAGEGTAASLPPRHAVVCVEDEWGRRLAEDLAAAGRAALTVGLDAPGADLRASAVRSAVTGTTFTAGGREWSVPLPGRFNVLNALCAIAAGRALGLHDDVVAAGLAAAGRVPGRFEPVDEGQAFGVLVDYAHTPDALENVLAAARPLADGRRVVCVFGCGGDRDRAKRPLMGELAARLADVVVVTSDNPRSEDPQAIIEEILGGIDREDVEVVADRRAAIGRAVALARPGDVVVVAGKGHEQGQELAGGEKIPFDDVTVSRAAIRALAPDGAPAS